MSPEVVGRREAACSPVPSGGGLVENRDFVLREWLATDEAISLVERAAAGLFREITVRGLWRALAGFEDGRTPLFDEALGELRSELVLFLCERTGLIGAIAANIQNRPESYLKAAFLNYLIDKSRNPKADPYRYLYKRTADCCRRSEDVSLSSGPAGGLFMSMEPAAFQAAALSEEDLARVSFPESMIHACDIESLGKKRVLLPLGVHFVTGTAKLFGRPDVGVAIRDFTAWLACHLDLKTPGKEGGGTKVFVETSSMRSHKDLDSALISEWASCFAGRLSPKETGVFYLHYACESSLTEIAEAMGFRGPSAAHYHLRNAIEKCRLFVRDLPGISVEDFDEEIFLEFYDVLIELLKKYAPVPYGKDRKQNGVSGDEIC